MTRNDITRLFESFDHMRVLVIGDVMIDSYFRGKVDRISPEAPVPVVHVNRSEKRLGGAANVARNIKALGATPILCSVIGNDLSGSRFFDILEKEALPADGILTSKERITTVKTRIMSGSQQMIRVDEEEIKPLSNEEKVHFENKIKELIDRYDIDVIMFEDYDKGLIDASLIKAVVSYAHINDIPVAVDPKKNNFLDYHFVDLFKPNLKELAEGLNIDLPTRSVEELIQANLKLTEHLNHKISLITMSELGVFVGDENGAEILPAHIRRIADVSGAGDTVISVASLCLAKKIPGVWIAKMSNLAGGLVCEKVGVVPVDKQTLLKECISLCDGEHE
ncbi:MAG: D-glycero-beta-D-manno-heptose-7-phosphate kinase [Crocinitomicaceae bacterium]|nr:D-glycero-beta-D-manno-heptose-7-phosphate kinase [Crocinitomicaceae bacterium]|tara:strand:+ start:21478 stop:22485 length:1008 start_codon:yes stop_codon:yes gene_type:complete